MLKFVALTAAALALSGPAQAQEPWPQHQVTFVVPFGAGGTADIFARLIADGLQAKYGKAFVVENRPGAGGNVGTAAVAKAAADGYTLLLGTVSSHGINPYVYKNLTYNVEKDFQPVCLIAKQPNLLVVGKKVPASVTDLKSFVAYVKANSGQLTFASSGVGTSQHMGGELFAKMTGAKITHVPYRSSADIMNAMLGGHVDFAFDNAATALPQVQAGNLRALAISGKTRDPLVPDLPTMDEVLKGFDATSWHGVFVLSGVPKPIVEQLSADIRTIIASPNVSKRITDIGATPAPLAPAEFSEFLRVERAKWRDLVQSIQLKID